MVQKSGRCVMVTKVQKWGNSLAVRIPKLLAQEMALFQDSPIEIIFREGELVMRPVMKPTYTLEDLIAQITPENVHGEWDTGQPVGNEGW